MPSLNDIGVSLICHRLGRLKTGIQKRKKKVQGKTLLHKTVSFNSFLPEENYL